MNDEITVILSNGSEWPLMVTGETDDEGNPCAADCIFDGHRGQYIYGAVVALAIEYDFKPQPDPITGELSRKSWSDREADEYVIETAEDAEEYLNDLLPDGYCFGFDNGSFYLANDAWWSLVSS